MILKPQNEFCYKNIADFFELVCQDNKDISVVSERYEYPLGFEIQQVPGDGYCVYYSLFNCLKTLSDESIILNQFEWGTL